ncbi:MAG: tRNA (adenosine(37)-N6)-threonylcarbamoyltransferase complex dimerization subunit type 1 TsaB [Thermodesulfobacteriota bacterium]
MRVLALDTSSTSGSMAVVRDGIVEAETNIEHVGTHGVWLMGALDALMKDAGLSLRDIDLFALSVGPGSFTGLRIGVSTVKGLAWALGKGKKGKKGGKEVAGVSTLDALSMNAPSDGSLVCPLLDARKGEIYAALYRPGNGSKDAGGEGGEGGWGMETLLPGCALKPEELIEQLLKFGPGPVTFLGGGLKPYSGYIRDSIKDAVFAPEELWRVRAVNVASLALEGFGERMSPEALSPLYLRKSEAELKKAACSVDKPRSFG